MSDRHTRQETILVRDNEKIEKLVIQFLRTWKKNESVFVSDVDLTLSSGMCDQNVYAGQNVKIKIPIIFNIKL